MTAHQRATLSFALGLVAAGVPAAVWAFIFAKSLIDPRAFHDQGGMFITIILFPLAFLAALVFGIPALVVGMVGSATRTGECSPGWRRAGSRLSAVGFLLAMGTCIGPRVLAEAVRWCRIC